MTRMLLLLLLLLAIHRCASTDEHGNVTVFGRTLIYASARSWRRSRFRRRSVHVDSHIATDRTAVRRTTTDGFIMLMSVVLSTRRLLFWTHSRISNSKQETIERNDMWCWKAVKRQGCFPRGGQHRSRSFVVSSGTHFAIIQTLISFIEKHLRFVYSRGFLAV